MRGDRSLSQRHVDGPRTTLPLAVVSVFVTSIVPPSAGCRSCCRARRFVTNCAVSSDAATPALGMLLLFGALVAMTLAATARNRKALQEVVQRQREESARVAGEMREIVRVPGDEVVETDDRVSVSKEPVAQVGAEKPRGSGDEHSHVVGRPMES